MMRLMCLLLALCATTFPAGAQTTDAGPPEAKINVQLGAQDLADNVQGIALTCRLFSRLLKSDDGGPTMVAIGAAILFPEGFAYDKSLAKGRKFTIHEVETLDAAISDTFPVPIHEFSDTAIEAWTHGECGMHLLLDSPRLLSSLKDSNIVLFNPTEDGRTALIKDCTRDKPDADSFAGCVMPGAFAPEASRFTFERPGFEAIK